MDGTTEQYLLNPGNGRNHVTLALMIMSIFGQMLDIIFIIHSLHQSHAYRTLAVLLKIVTL